MDDFFHGQLEGLAGGRAYRSPAKRNAHPGIQFGIAGTENSPRAPIFSRIGTCPRSRAPSTPRSAGSCLRRRHAERTESTVRQIPLGSAVIVIGRPSQLPLRLPSICRAVIGVGPRSAWGDISRAQVAGADLHGAVKDPLGMRGRRTGAAGDFHMHVVELIRDLSLPACETVVEPDRKVRPVELVVIRHGVRFQGGEEDESCSGSIRRATTLWPSDRLTSGKGPPVCLR